jgi:hypothetical protein
LISDGASGTSPVIDGELIAAGVNQKNRPSKPEITGQSRDHEPRPKGTMS